FNPASERVFGFTRAEAIGQELAELIIPPRTRERHRQGLAHYLKTGEGPLLGKLIEIEALRRDGAEILVQLAITALEVDGAPIFERLRRGERIVRYDTIGCRKDGTLLDISLAISPIKDESGQVIGASRIARDITERVRNDRRRATQYLVASLLAGSWTLAEAGTQILEAVAASGDWAYAAIWVYDDVAGGLRCRNLWHE